MSGNSPRLRVLFDTTVFCVTLVNPDGGNMQCLILAQGPLFTPVVSQMILHEFVHVTTQRGLGEGSRRRVYTWDEIMTFLGALAPLLQRAQPVGLTAILPLLYEQSGERLGQVLQRATNRWPTRWPDTALNVPVQGIDVKDGHVMLAVAENRADVLVTSNVEDFNVLTEVCAVESPSRFLRRWILG